MPERSARSQPSTRPTPTTLSGSSLDGVDEPLQQVLGRIASEWVDRLDADARPAQRLAARAHHLRRWEIPRSSFPEGRAGYLRWRTAAKTRHAKDLVILLRDQGWDEDTVEEARRLVRKEGLGRDPAVQVHEDAVCLAFLTVQLDEAAELMGDKTPGVLRRTAAKMSPAALAPRRRAAAQRRGPGPAGGGPRPGGRGRLSGRPRRARCGVTVTGPAARVSGSRGRSSAGRASPCQGEGRRFESGRPLHTEPPAEQGVSSFSPGIPWPGCLIGPPGASLPVPGSSVPWHTVLCQKLCQNDARCRALWRRLVRPSDSGGLPAVRATSAVAGHRWVRRRDRTASAPTGRSARRRHGRPARGCDEPRQRSQGRRANLRGPCCVRDLGRGRHRQDRAGSVPRAADLGLPAGSVSPPSVAYARLASRSWRPSTIRTSPSSSLMSAS